jgi:hypothetical protein
VIKSPYETENMAKIGTPSTCSAYLHQNPIRAIREIRD